MRISNIYVTNYFLKINLRFFLRSCIITILYYFY